MNNQLTNTVCQGWHALRRWSSGLAFRWSGGGEVSPWEWLQGPLRPSCFDRLSGLEFSLHAHCSPWSHPPRPHRGRSHNSGQACDHDASSWGFSMSAVALISAGWQVPFLELRHVASCPVQRRGGRLSRRAEGKRPWEGRPGSARGASGPAHGEACGCSPNGLT